MIFPVQNGDGKTWRPTFYDSFGEARGTPDAPRAHQGIDIFAPIGAYLYARATGTLKHGTDPLGGTVLTITEPNGDRHYYAHLSEYVGSEGKVKAGDIVARVGITGDAKGTKAHLHYEYHPGGGPAIDPYNSLVKDTRLDKTPSRWAGPLAVLALIGMALATFVVYKDR